MTSSDGLTKIKALLGINRGKEALDQFSQLFFQTLKFHLESEAMATSPNDDIYYSYLQSTALGT